MGQAATPLYYHLMSTKYELTYQSQQYAIDYRKLEFHSYNNRRGHHQSCFLLYFGKISEPTPHFRPLRDTASAHTYI